jgi:AAA family ATP:ADP antiporter
VTLFFILNLELFWLGAKLGIPYLGVAFYIWVGIFNNAIIAQFWSYGNDIYQREVGERLFPIIGIGATLGSPLGSGLAARLFSMGVGAYSLLHITAGILLSMGRVLAVGVAREGSERRQWEKLKAGEGGFALLAKSPYLRLICLLFIILNLVNTTGEYVLAKYVLAEVAQRTAADPSFNREAFLGSFYGGYLFWVNVVTVLIQSLLVAHCEVSGTGRMLALPLRGSGGLWIGFGGSDLYGPRGETCRECHGLPS